jgi:membrane protein DedA with SNARE-associated domain
MLLGMTHKRARAGWIGAAVVVGGAGMAGRGLLRSGAVADGLLSHWWAQAVLAVIVVAVLATAAYFVKRAYRH